DPAHRRRVGRHGVPRWPRPADDSTLWIMKLQMAHFRLQIYRALVVCAVAAFAAGCTAGKAFHAGEDAMNVGNLDEAVAQYRKAVQADPENPNYKIALQRAMLAASRVHIDRAIEYEKQDQLEAALSEYRLAAEYDPANRISVSKISAIERTLRDRAEAARP